VLSAKKAEHFKQLLKARIAELERVLAAAQRETRPMRRRHRTEEAGSHSVGAMLRQMSRSKGAGLSFHFLLGPFFGYRVPRVSASEVSIGNFPTGVPSTSKLEQV